MFENKKPFKNSREHLEEELALLELQIKRQIAILNLTNPASNKFDEFSGMYISEEEIKHFLDKPGSDRQDIYGHKNVKALTAEIDKLRKHIDQRVGITLGKDVKLRLPELVNRFQLTGTELNILICCLAPDIDTRFERYYAYLQNDVSKRRPSIQLLSRMFLGERAAVFKAREVFKNDTGLLGKNLFTIDAFASADETPFPARQPAVADSVIDFLLETDHLDVSLQETAHLTEPRPMEMYARYFDHHMRILENLVHHYEDHGRIPPTYIGGPEGAGKAKLVETFAAVTGKKVLTIDYTAIMGYQGDMRRLFALIEREARLHNCILHIRLKEYGEFAENMNREKSRTAVLYTFLQESRLHGIVITGIKSYNRIKNSIGGNLFAFYIPMPSVEERYEIWNRLLNCTSAEDGEDLITGLAVKFRFTPGRIQSVLDSAALTAHTDKENHRVIELQDIYRCCREESNQGLLSFSRKIVPHYKWEDIILPQDTLDQLKEICISIQHRRKVYWEWGFESKFSLGKGLNILLAGPPGIGKTMSAEIIAGELGLDLYKIDLSCVVSKYIGETEKNLSRIFNEAETSNCILFFDEADALFGKRTEVRDSHDRYANIEINFLLQKMDEYDGVVLMATNMRKNLDSAFARRLHHVVEFPFPDEKYREAIWRNAFPHDTPRTDDIDYAFLAGKFKIPGGNIKNIVVNSAFLASANGGKVNMENIILAVKREYQKMGKMCSKSDFGQYYNLVREVRE